MSCQNKSLSTFSLSVQSSRINWLYVVLHIVSDESRLSPCFCCCWSLGEMLINIVQMCNSGTFLCQEIDQYTYLFYWNRISWLNNFVFWLLLSWEISKACIYRTLIYISITVYLLMYLSFFQMSSLMFIENEKSMNLCYLVLKLLGIRPKQSSFSSVLLNALLHVSCNFVVSISTKLLCYM